MSKYIYIYIYHNIYHIMHMYISYPILSDHIISHYIKSQHVPMSSMAFEETVKKKRNYVVEVKNSCK